MFKFPLNYKITHSRYLGRSGDFCLGGEREGAFIEGDGSDLTDWDIVTDKYR